MKLNHYDFLMDNDRDLFRDLCWIFFPLMQIIGDVRPNLSLIKQLNSNNAGTAEFNSEGWLLTVNALPLSNCYFSAATRDIDFRISLSPLEYIRLTGKIVTPWADTDESAEFTIMNHRFCYHPETSIIPTDVHNPEKNFFAFAYDTDEQYEAAVEIHQKNLAQSDHEFYSWHKEVRHLSTLTKVSL